MGWGLWQGPFVMEVQVISGCLLPRRWLGPTGPCSTPGRSSRSGWFTHTHLQHGVVLHCGELPGFSSCAGSVTVRSLLLCTVPFFRADRVQRGCGRPVLHQAQHGGHPAGLQHHARADDAVHRGAAARVQVGQEVCGGVGRGLLVGWGAVNGTGAAARVRVGRETCGGVGRGLRVGWGAVNGIGAAARVRVGREGGR